MPTGFVRDKKTMTAVAGGRATLYGVLVAVFGSIPEKDFLKKIKGRDLRDLLNTWYERGDQQFQSGVDHIRAYQAQQDHSSDAEVLNELSVDRTRLLRTPGNAQLKPPYEGLYKDEKGSSGASALELRSVYRKAGLLPDEEVRESPDFLCIQLDFMSKLCQREQEQWQTDLNAGETIAFENKFLTEHLGTWVGNFCSQAQTHAATEFYRGFLLILDAFVAMDMEYLQGLLAEVSQ